MRWYVRSPGVQESHTERRIAARPCKGFNGVGSYAVHIVSRGEEALWPCVQAVVHWRPVMRGSTLWELTAWSRQTDAAPMIER